MYLFLFTKKLKFKGIKKTVKIVFVVVALLLLLCGTAITILKSSRVQHYLVTTATNYFSEKFGSKVQIGSVDYALFNKVLLQEVYLEDLKGDTLLYAETLKMGFKPLDLLQNKVICNYIELKNSTVNLVLDKKKVLNASHIFKYFKTNKTESKVTYQLQNITITNARFRYSNLTARPKNNGFDKNYLQVSGLNGTFNLHKLTNNYLSCDIKSLSFSEKSGITLSDFKASITANKTRARIENLQLKLPHSFVDFSPVIVNYGHLKNLQKEAEKVQLNFMIKPSEIAFRDLKAFSPLFERTRGKIYLSTQFKGCLGDMKIKNLALSYNNDISLRGDINLIGLPKIGETYIYTKIRSIKTDKNKLQDLMSNVLGRPIQLPDEMSKLGIIQYKGNISGFFSDLVVFGTIKTAIGNIFTDLLMGVYNNFTGINYRGSVQTKELKIGSLFGEQSGVGNIDFNISSEGSIQQKGNIKGTLEGTVSSLIFKNYNYKNIDLKGDFNKKVFDGIVSLNDENAQFDFNGKIDFSERLPSGKFKMQVKKLNLEKTNITKKHKDLTLALNINTSFTGSKIEETDTEILIDSFYLYTKEKELFSKKMHISSTIYDSINVLKINSDLIKGTVKGNYSFLSLGKSLTTMIANYLPSLQEKKKSKKTKKLSPNNFVFYFTDINVDEIADLLNVNLKLSPKTLISGFYNDQSNKFRLEILIPSLQKGKNNYKDLSLLCNNELGAIQLTSSTVLNNNMHLHLHSEIINDSIALNVDWRNPSVFSGEFKATSIFSKNEAEKLQADIAIQPSQIWIKDSLWNIHASTVKTDFKSLTISNFILDHQHQFIQINGIASSSPTDSLFVKLQEIELNYILSLAKVKSPKIEGLVTGNALVQNVFNKMLLQLDVFAKDFKFNNALWGDVTLKSKWNEQDKKLEANGFCMSNNNKAFDIAGEYFPKKDSLEFYADINKLGIDFLRYYLDNALQNVSGEGSGKLHIYGGLKRFQLAGDIFVKNGRFNVDFLKTAYHFTDTIKVRKEEIRFDKIKLYDSENNWGVLTGRLSHKHFKDMRYRFDIKCNNVLAMNTTSKDNEDFYGKAYGTGTVRVTGNYSQVNFNINMKTEPNTKVVIPMVTSAIATENSFIQFISKPSIKSSNTTYKTTQSAINAPTSGKTNIHVYLQLEATPDAEIKLITDPVGGDMVRAEGNGDLKIDYTNNGDIKLYGNYEVERGDYIFTLQQVVRKNFTIKRGGTIRWAGNPYEAIIDLNATYTVPSVSLLDILDETELEGVSRTSTPVNCLLNLTGDLMQPTIKFDLELPSDPELQRKIKYVVNTDEMMNREILALLVMNRFYKPDYLQTERTGLGTEMVSVLTTTVSGQLNNWLSKINEKVNVGLDARMGNGQDFSNGGEYKIGINYQPNNRLIINSNLGYRDDMINTTTTNFIGDVDIEYKLNRSGKFRAKAYTHSADNFFVNASGTAKTTQGLGLMYREDFNKFSDVIRYYFNKNAKKPDTTKVTNQTTPIPTNQDKPE